MANNRKKKLEELVNARNQDANSFFTEKKPTRNEVGKKQKEDSNKFKKEATTRATEGRTSRSYTNNTSNNEYMLPTRGRLGNRNNESSAIDRIQPAQRAERIDYFKGMNLNSSNIGNRQQDVSRKVFETLNPGQKLNYTKSNSNVFNYGISDFARESLLPRISFVGKSTGAGVASGTAGIGQAYLTHSANQAQKGSQADTKQTLKNVVQFFNPMLGFSGSVGDIGNSIANTIRDKDKSTSEKVGEILTNVASGAMNLTPHRQVLNSGMQVGGKLFGQDMSNNLMTANEKISKPIREMNQKLAEEGEQYDSTTRMLAQTGQVVGNMAPSIAVTALTKNPNAGLTVMGLSAKGQATEEALQRGADLDKAVKIGDAKEMVEVGTEMLTGGLNIFGKGALDKIVERGIDKKVKSKVMNYLTKQGMGIAGEVGEETISDILNTVIDKGTVDKNATYSIDDWKDTTLTTMLSTVVLNALGGGYTPRAYNQNVQDMQQFEVKEELRQSINENSTLSKQDKNQMLDYIDNNYITEADNLAMKQTLGIEEQENVEDNRNSNDVQEQNNEVKEELLQRIEKSTLSNEDKAQMIDYIRNNELSNADHVAMNQVLDNATPASNELSTNQNYKDNADARRKYAQYKNDTGEYNSKVVDEVLDVTPINRNGRRTVKQWLGAAQEIGTRIADLSNEEIERIAYKSWFDAEPSKNITKYDNQTKSNVGFQKLTSDEWINSINKGVNEARAKAQNSSSNNNINNNKQNIDNQRKKRQLEIINNTNPSTDDVHTWIRSVEDIKSFDEAFFEDGEYSGMDPDFTEEMANSAKKSGKITVYSSYPIENGTFVSPSQMEASQYAGGDTSKLYTKEVDISDIAWIDGAEGQYAKVEDSLANNQETLYNNNESESDINGHNSNEQTGTEGTYQQKDGREQGQTRDRANTDPEESSVGSQNQNDAETYYREFEQQARDSQITNISKESQTVKKVAKAVYNKDILYFDDNKTKFSGGLSKIDKTSILFGKNAVESYGDAFLLGHEIGEDMLKYHGEKVEKTYEEFKERIQKDDNFPNVFLDYMLSMNKELRATYAEHPELIAKELICDTVGFMQNDNELGNNLPRKEIQDVWINKLDSNLIAEMKQRLKQHHDEIYLNNTPNKTVLEKTDESVLKVKLQPDEKMPSNLSEEEHIAKILEKPQEQVKKKSRSWAIFKANFIDKGIVFEDMAKKTNNRELEGKYDYTLMSEARAQRAIGKARYEFDSTTKKERQICKSLTDIIDEVGENDSEFNEYMYHLLNIDRMTLDERLGKENKPVFAKGMTADKSRNIVAELEDKHPEYKEYAQDVYDFLDANTQELVDNGVISKDTQKLFKEMYPHWVPIKRVTDTGEAVSIPLDTKRTGINSPIKRAKGGNSDIYPLFQTIAERTEQTYKASARNSFGVELKNTLEQLNSLNQNTETTDIDTIMDSMMVEEQSDELLKQGKGNEPPTFTVFENGEKVTFQINEDIYDALKPKNELLSKLDNTLPAKIARKISSFRRGVLTEYNPVFIVTNGFKDTPDVVLNSQHPDATFAKYPEAVAQIREKGYWYTEYMQNGGEQNSYFTEGDFVREAPTIKNKAKNILTVPLKAISKVNNIVEMTPRLAEYIASREEGRSIQVSMLDAARVTTNFKAGGDVTKFVNRNGATFLNASIQGMQQQFRNIREASMKGVKGWVGLACRAAVAGVPALIFNNLIWDDDDDYEELSDYIRDNYYMIGKLPNGNFLRIPKGRATATIQKILVNGQKFIKDSKTLDIDELASRFFKDIKEDLEFAGDNLAPNNPLDNNIVSPIIQAITNKTWYGDDLVPTRLQDKPSREQFDESTDKFSKWLGDKTGISPIKINYLLDQYSGGIGDVLLPMGTPQAENNVVEDKFTTNPIMKNRNPGDLFEKADELKVLSNSDNAKDEDILKYKFISGVSSDMSELYKEKREIQNSDDTDEDKKKKIIEVQKQINNIAKQGLKDIDTLKIKGDTATIGDERFYKKDGKWEKLKDKEAAKAKDVGLVAYSDYQNKIYELAQKKKSNANKNDKTVKYVDKVKLLLDADYSDKDKEEIYSNFVSAVDKTYPAMKKTGMSIDEYLTYKSQGFKADKDKNGKSINGTKKKKEYAYVNKMDLSYGQKLILLGTQYQLSSGEKSKVATYVNELDLTAKEKLSIYDRLQGFKVKGNKVSW